MAGAQEATASFGETLGALARNFGGSESGGGELSGRLIQLFGLLTVLSLAPGLLVVMTSFTRFVIVLSMLRLALGLNQSPPNMVITSLALFLTFFVMQSAFQDSWEDGLAPLIEGSISEEQALPRIAAPFHRFMAANTRDADLALFQRFSDAGRAQTAMPGPQLPDEQGDAITLPADRSELSWSVLVPAFMISELRRAFTIGFLIYLPFIAIDLITASILMGAGMMMLSPVMISLPFKVIFFVLIDGWYMLAGSLIQSYAAG
ncbi:flagellar type III secretion system pore protein FliP [Sulfitobacter aestuarii]|uniref:Flagellar biosynthetic protein FliP n=1 Tax=Sulfitobacter aestuarii TaxID=2161676 RepID=A0ABW5U0Y7_9RHOB